MSEANEEKPEPRDDARLDDVRAGESVLPRLEAVGGFSARVRLPSEDGAEDASGAVDEPGAGTPGPKYRIEGELGRGGVGVVLRGSDGDLGRDVAIKVLHEELLDKPDVLKRFIEEAQIGGQLQHPGVVPVYELGVRDGRPFFAMKLIRGRSLAELLAARTSPRDDRRRFLGIFEAVCHTLAYAHARGVIHRDLKPENVMVGAFGEVQVVDWGMGKVLGSRDRAGATIAPADDDEALRPLSTVRSDSPDGRTVLGSMMGTPGYMPPEQVRGQVDHIDERSDVYALGAMLFEILVGEPPHTGTPLERVRAALAGDLERVEARLDDASVDDELRALVLGCLQKEPDERPASARVLADTVRGYLEAAEERAQRAQIETAQARASEAEAKAREAEAQVHATEARAAMEREHAEAEQSRLRAQAERRRRRAAAILALVLLVGMVGTTLGLLTAVRAKSAEAERAEAERRERLRATRAEAEANTQRGLAEANEAEAKDQLALATAISEFLRHDLLGQASSAAQADRLFEQDPDLSVREALDRAALGVGLKFADRPREEAAIRYTLGSTYRQLGAMEEAIDQLERALALREELGGPDHVETTMARSELGHAYVDASRYPEAIRELERVRDTQARTFGEDGAEYESAIHNLASTYIRAGRTREAIDILEAIVARHGGVEAIEDDGSALVTLQQLAGAYDDVRRYEEGMALLEKVHRGLESTLGADHPSTLKALNNLAGAYDSVGRDQEALELYEKVAERYAKNLGPEHPDALMSRHNLATAYMAVGRTPQAAQMLEEIRGQVTESLGADHFATLVVMHNLAKSWFAINRRTEAIELLQDVIRRRVATIGPHHPETLKALNHLGFYYWLTNQFARGAETFEKVVAGARVQFGEDAEYTISAAYNLAANLRDDGQAERAAEVIETWLPRGMRIDWRDAAMRLAGPGIGAEVFLATGRDAQAVSSILFLLEELEAQDGPRDVSYANRLATLSDMLVRAKAYAEAEPRLRTLVEIRRKVAPEAWTTYNAVAMLGAALAGQGKLEEAEPLLLEGYRGMKEREDEIPEPARVRVAQALERIVDLYTALGRTEDAETWRAEGAR